MILMIVLANYILDYQIHVLLKQELFRYYTHYEQVI